MRLLLITVLFLTACSARQVQRSKSNQLEEVKTDVSVKTASQSNSLIIDQSQTKTKAVDKSKVFESAHTTIRADEAEYDKSTGKLNLKGNVRIDHKGEKQTENDKQTDIDQTSDLKATVASKTTSDSSSKKKDLKKKDALNKNSKSDGLAFNKWWFWLILPVAMFAAFKAYRQWKL